MEVSSPHLHQVNATVVVTTRNTASIVMGILAILLAVPALLFSWIPFIGMIAIPLGCVGGLLALIGLVVAACHRFKSWLLPVIGGGLCLLAILISLIFTSAAGAAWSEEAAKQKALQETQQKKIRETFDSSVPPFPTPPGSSGKATPPGLKF